MHAAVVGGATTVIRSATLDEPGGRWRLPGRHAARPLAERPLVRPNVSLRSRRQRPARHDVVLLPHGHDGSPLPVLLDPYGGPHAQRVVRSHNAHLTSQWFADQGFAVLVADGRGTPGRGTAYERAVLHDLAHRGARRPGRPRCTPPPNATPSSTSIAWRSAGGASAATSPRWP